MNNQQKDYILPFMIADHSANGRVVVLNDSITKIISQHQYPKIISKLLCDLLVISCFLGQNLKSKGIITCQIQSRNNFLKLLVAEYVAGGKIRGYAGYDETADFSSVSFENLINDAQFIVTIESGDEKYQGVIALTENSIAKCFEKYLAQSEQIDASVVINCSEFSRFDDLELKATGILIKKMPELVYHNDDDWGRYEHFLHSLSQKELETLEAEEILKRLFHADGVIIFDKQNVQFECRCSREKMESLISNISESERKEITVDGKISIKCQFCNREEIF